MKLISNQHIYDNLADAVLAAVGDVVFSDRCILPRRMSFVTATLCFALTDDR
jgi:hypothetical protein